VDDRAARHAPADMAVNAVVEHRRACRRRPRQNAFHRPVIANEVRLIAVNRFSEEGD